jgi:hypothetical protein
MIILFSCTNPLDKKKSKIWKSHWTHMPILVDYFNGNIDSSWAELTSDLLIVLNEPEINSSKVDEIRFIYQPAFLQDQTFRILQKNDFKDYSNEIWKCDSIIIKKGTVNWLRLMNGFDTISPRGWMDIEFRKNIYTKIENNFSKTTPFDSLVRLINLYDFYNQKPELSKKIYSGDDGYSYILEAKLKGRYHVVYRWAPEAFLRDSKKYKYEEYQQDSILGKIFNYMLSLSVIKNSNQGL